MDHAQVTSFISRDCGLKNSFNIATKKPSMEGNVATVTKFIELKQKLMILKRLTLVQGWDFLVKKFSYLHGCNVARVFSCACSIDRIFVHISMESVKCRLLVAGHCFAFAEKTQTFTNAYISLHK